MRKWLEANAPWGYAIRLKVHLGCPISHLGCPISHRCPFWLTFLQERHEVVHHMKQLCAHLPLTGCPPCILPPSALGVHHAFCLSGCSTCILPPQCTRPPTQRGRHEAVHAGNEDRFILLLDLPHPDLPPEWDGSRGEGPTLVLD
jgi:hypothetical protein